MAKEFSKYKGFLMVALVLKNMKGNGRKMKCQDMEHIYMLMELYIGDNGKIISIMGEDSTNFLMEQIMRVTGKII